MSSSPSMSAISGVVVGRGGGACVGGGGGGSVGADGMLVGGGGMGLEPLEMADVDVDGGGGPEASWSGYLWRGRRLGGERAANREGE